MSLMPMMRFICLIRYGLLSGLRRKGGLEPEFASIVLATLFMTLYVSSFYIALSAFFKWLPGIDRSIQFFVMAIVLVAHIIAIRNKPACESASVWHTQLKNSSSFFLRNYIVLYIVGVFVSIAGALTLYVASLEGVI